MAVISLFFPLFIIKCCNKMTIVELALQNLSIFKQFYLNTQDAKQLWQNSEQTHSIEIFA